MCRHPRLLRFFALLMALAMLPGWGEVFESVDHLVRLGHLPHSAGHELHADHGAPPMGPAEHHGCTPVSHTCGARSLRAVVFAAARVPPPVLFLVPTGNDRPLEVEPRMLERATPPPKPPPIA